MQSPNGCGDPAFTIQPLFGEGELAVRRRRPEGWWCAGMQKSTVIVGKSSTLPGSHFPHLWSGVMKHSLPYWGFGKTELNNPIPNTSFTQKRAEPEALCAGQA